MWANDRSILQCATHRSKSYEQTTKLDSNVSFIAQNLIYWPEKIALHKLPSRFKKKYPHCLCKECTEIFIERPFNLNARAKTCSNYKQQITKIISNLQMYCYRKRFSYDIVLFHHVIIFCWKIFFLIFSRCCGGREQFILPHYWLKLSV